jgi:hypothetical protein
MLCHLFIKLKIADLFAIQTATREEILTREKKNTIGFIFFMKDTSFICSSNKQPIVMLSYVKLSIMVSGSEIF